MHLVNKKHFACSEHVLDFDDDSGKKRDKGGRACHEHQNSNAERILPCGGGGGGSGVVGGTPWLTRLPPAISRAKRHRLSGWSSACQTAPGWWPTVAVGAAPTSPAARFPPGQDIIRSVSKGAYRTSRLVKSRQSSSVITQGVARKTIRHV